MRCQREESKRPRFFFSVAARKVRRVAPFRSGSRLARGTRLSLSLSLLLSRLLSRSSPRVLTVAAPTPLAHSLGRGSQPHRDSYRLFFFSSVGFFFFFFYPLFFLLFPLCFYGTRSYAVQADLNLTLE